MDIALILSNEDCKYNGSLSDNTESQYNSIDWLDHRIKPTWQELQDKWVVLSERLVKLERKKTILAELLWIDSKSVRPLREGNIDKVNELESQAVILRNELNLLGV